MTFSKYIGENFELTGLFDRERSVSELGRLYPMQ